TCIPLASEVTADQLLPLTRSPHKQQKRTTPSQRCWRWHVCAISVCVYSSARSGSSQERAAVHQDNRRRHCTPALGCYQRIFSRHQWQGGLAHTRDMRALLTLFVQC